MRRREFIRLLGGAAIVAARGACAAEVGNPQELVLYIRAPKRRWLFGSRRS